MSQNLTPEQWNRLTYQLSSHPLGTGVDVVCDDCYSSIKDGEEAKAYITGHDEHWSIRRIFHPECSQSLFTEESVGEHEEQEGIVYGQISQDPAIERQAEDDRKAAEQQFKQMVGDDAAFTTISPDPPRHHLTNIKLGVVFIPGQGRIKEIDEEK